MKYPVLNLGNCYLRITPKILRFAKNATPEQIKEVSYCLALTLNALVKATADEF